MYPSQRNLNVFIFLLELRAKVDFGPYFFSSSYFQSAFPPAKVDTSQIFERLKIIFSSFFPAIYPFNRYCKKFKRTSQTFSKLSIVVFESFSEN